MEIIVPIKQVPDVALNIKVKDGAVVEEGLSYVISSWDETALEAALQITEDVGGEVTLLTIGPEKAAESLRKGLAMGAHKAIHVKYNEAKQTDSFAYAKILQKVLEGREYDLILTGKQAQDTDAGLTASMLAEFLGLPQVTNIIRFSDVSEQSITLYRKGDHATEVLEMELPGVVTVNDSLNEPRLASMRGIMMAKKKPLEEIELDAIGVSVEMSGAQGSMTEVLQYDKPESRKEGKSFEGDETETVKQAMELLVSEAKFLA
ncbi:MAG: electron transfer flavoprotein subunit beta/FixA family protein [Proteobacteria bacterium]|nr:electron transfer flavoprotein subunit beta/FixA family protein [Pseudomonadota bacterium]MBT5793234.1 electron transfer flavoprotein subunit beta/FixA family protein [Deltaproteobacteria bacterium]MDB3917228.1 electron transfer flavoprotein subunit beta/FixA family protein [bacterium]